MLSKERDDFKTPPVLGGLGEKKSNNGTQYYVQDRIYDSNYLAMCLCSNQPGGSYWYLIRKEVFTNE